MMILAMADWEEVVYDLSYGAIFSDPEWPPNSDFDVECLRNGTI